MSSVHRADMYTTKYIVPLLITCFIYAGVCTPLPNNVSEGRGFGSTVWGWITYPFSWWSTGSTEIPPEDDHITGPAPDLNIEIAKRNVTVWCNDQTCTTMQCDKDGCSNVTCSIYDTDLRGECRSYNTGVESDADVTSKPIQEETNTSPQAPVVITTSEGTNINTPIEERPIELEAVLSSTVTKVDEVTKS